MRRPYEAVSSPRISSPEGRSTPNPLQGNPCPREGSFAVKQSLQSAHGLCGGCRVTRASAQGDDDAAVAISVIKGVNKAAARRPDYESFLFGDKETGRRYTPRRTSLWAPPRSSAAALCDQNGRWSPCHRPQLL